MSSATNWLCRNALDRNGSSQTCCLAAHPDWRVHLQHRRNNTHWSGYVCACACTRCVRVRVFVRKKTVHDRACLTLRCLLVSSGQRAVNFYKRFILDKGSAIVSGYFIRLDDVVYSVYFMVTTVQSDFCWLHRCKRFQYALVLCSCLLLCSNVSEPDLGVSILFQCLRFVSLYVQPWEKAPMKS